MRTVSPDTSTPLRKRGRPVTGKALSAAERMRRLRARRKSAGLRAVVTWTPTPTQGDTGSPWSDHQLHEIRSLAMHALIAKKIDRDRSLLSIPKRNLKRWRARFTAAPPRWWQEWSRILERPWEEIAALLVDPGEHARRLRQSTPFVGILTPEQRRQLHAALRA